MEGKGFTLLAATIPELLPVVSGAYSMYPSLPFIVTLSLQVLISWDLNGRLVAFFSV